MTVSSRGHRDVYHYKPSIEFRYRFLAITRPYTIARGAQPGGGSIPTIAENIRIPIRRYRAMRNSSKPRLSAAERLYLAELVRLELTSLN